MFIEDNTADISHPGTRSFARVEHFEILLFIRRITSLTTRKALQALSFFQVAKNGYSPCLNSGYPTERREHINFRKALLALLQQCAPPFFPRWQYLHRFLERNIPPQLSRRICQFDPPQR